MFEGEDGSQGEKLALDLVTGGPVMGFGGFGANEGLSRAGSHRQCRELLQGAVQAGGDMSVRPCGCRILGCRRNLWRIIQFKPKRPTWLLRKGLTSSLKHCGAKNQTKTNK